MPIGDADALATAVNQVLANIPSYQRDAQLIGQSFAPDQTAAEYLKLFQSLQNDTVDSSTPEPEPYERLREMRDSYKLKARDN